MSDTTRDRLRAAADACIRAFHQNDHLNLGRAAEAIDDATQLSAIVRAARELCDAVPVNHRERRDVLLRLLPTPEDPTDGR